MSAISVYLEDLWLRTIALGTAYSAAATYIALYTAAPSDAGGGTEVTGGSYARTLVNQDGATAPYWSNPADASGPQEITNTGEVLFPTATAGWGNVTHFAVMDAITGGNVLYWGILDAPHNVDATEVVRFASGLLKIQLG